MNWKFQFVPAELRKRTVASPTTSPNYKNIKKRWVEVRNWNGVPKKILKDPCPHCKFNMMSGNDKCDVCGKDL
jgi:hypothetical protein